MTGLMSGTTGEVLNRTPIGLVVSQPEDIELATELKFDFVEIHSSAILDAQVRSSISRSEIPFKILASPVPRSSNLSAHVESQREAAIQLFTRACRNAQELGIELLSLGFGVGRSVPEGLDKGVAQDNLLYFVDRLGKIADTHSMRIAIEVLDVSRSNTFTTCRELAEFINTLGASNVGILIDLAQNAISGHSLSTEIADAGDLLFHLQTCEPTTRRAPVTVAPQRDLARAAAHHQYGGPLSVELRGDLVRAELAPALTLLRDIWTRPVC